MPEELALVLLVLFGIIWVIVAILKGIANFISGMQKSAVEASLRRKEELKRKEAQELLSRKDTLQPYIIFSIPNLLPQAEKKIKEKFAELEVLKSNTVPNAEPPVWTNIEFKPFKFFPKTERYHLMMLSDIQLILTPNEKSWIEEERELLNHGCGYENKFPSEKHISIFKELPKITANIEEAYFRFDGESFQKSNSRLFSDGRVIDLSTMFYEEKNKVEEYNKKRAELLKNVELLNSEINNYNIKTKIKWENFLSESRVLWEQEKVKFDEAAAKYISDCKKQKEQFKQSQNAYQKGTKSGIIERINFILGRLNLPDSIPHTWDSDFDGEEQIAVVEVGLPDVVHHVPQKGVRLVSGVVPKPLNQKEKRELVPAVHPAVLLRYAYEIFRNDNANKIKVLVLNGWVRFDDPRTGQTTKAYTASLMVTKDQIINLNLKKLDPLAAFNNLKGKSAGAIAEIVPVVPTLSLNRKDSRFVNAKEVLNQIGTETNLAAMDWQDFEHLIRELFEREFAKPGVEVKVTQASRDRGVDAIVFDPDPIKGGKFVIQAKRYTNTVDVSAVRDLCAVVKKEGASRGILVTTSTYGSDAYAFANNEPVTLLNGAELLGLLQKHGYKFRVDLAEARKLNREIEAAKNT